MDNKNATPAIHVFVISLKNDTGRRESITRHLENHGFAFEFFDAIDGRQMDVALHPDYNAKRRLRSFGRHIKPGELGCLLSHLGTYKEIVKRNIPYTLVLEDDVILHEDTKKVLEAFIASNHDFDLLRLLSDKKINGKGKKHRIVKPIIDPYNLIRLLTTPGGMYATLISQNGAQKLVKAHESFAFPVDALIGRSWEHGLNSYTVLPELAHEGNEFESTIGNQRFNKTLEISGLRKITFPLTRALFKLEETIGKRYWFWKTALKDKKHNKQAA